MGKSSPTKFRRRGIAAILAAVAAATMMVLSQRAASAAGAKTADATVVKGDGSGPLVGEGGSHTPFQLGLPPQAKCPGDTATNHFNVYGFVVAAPTDPGTLTYDSATGPNNNPQAFPLVDTFGSSYNAANLAPNSGQIYPSGPPTFDFAVFSATQAPQLVPGSYSIGLACVKSDGPTPGATVTYFSVQISITAKASDPNGFAFTVTSSTPPTGTTTTSTTVAGTTTTSTTVADTTTTSTTVADTTSTTGDPGSTTTSTTTGSGSTTTTSTTSTTSGAGGSTTTTTTGGATGAAGGSTPLATTGSSATMSLYDWGVALVSIGLVVLLGARRRGWMNGS